MTKSKKKEVKAEKPAPPKKQKTLKQRIDEVVSRYEDKGDSDELKKEIFKLIQRALYPEQFCPECDDRLFFNPATASYSCPNCGYESQPQTQIQPRRAPLGKVPKGVEQVIQQAEEAGNPKRRRTGPTKKGRTIRELVDQMDGVGAPPTRDIEDRVKQDPNIGRDVNWV